MNFSQYFIQIPYQLGWKVSKFFRKETRIDFLCGNIVDYVCFKNIHELMPEVRIVARNRKVKKQLLGYNIKAGIYPNFPDVIIMARHLTRKYPVKKIIKIGMTHGAYNFKKLISPSEYNAFDLYFFTSSAKEKEARGIGIQSGKPIGYPKLDKAFSKDYFELESYKKKLQLDESKPTLIFSATWDKKGYSAIDQWYQRLNELTSDYNVLVTVHAWTSQEKIEKIKKTKNVKYIEDKNILPYLMIADLMIGDTSSILGEFCALDKPMITFEIPLVKRMTEETKNMLEEISFRIKTFDEIPKKILQALQKPNFHKEKRAYYNKIMFDILDGKASKRAKDSIRKLIKEKYETWHSNGIPR